MAAEVCRAAREAAQDAFDQGLAPPDWVGEHSGACSGCAEFLRRLDTYRRLLPDSPGEPETERREGTSWDAQVFTGAVFSARRRRRALALGGGAAAAVLLAVVPLGKAGLDRRWVRLETASYTADLIQAPLLPVQTLLPEFQDLPIDDFNARYFKLNDEYSL